MGQAGKFLRRWSFEGRGGYIFYCPGCKAGHTLQTDAPEGWNFNGDLERPTFSPSVALSRPGSGKIECHSFVRNGQIEFLSDCEHELAGKTVPLPEWPADHGTGDA
jgi:hypothetical protein